MKILVIGGTKFIGRHLSEILLAQGHDLYLFNRGQSNPALFPSVPKLIGDRSDYKALSTINTHSFDVIFDMCAYYPDELELLFDTIKDFHSHYVLLSTVSVYKDIGRLAVSESSPLLDCSYAQRTDTSKESYGARKAECERITIKRLATTKWTMIRPTVVFGPCDPTYRINWWIDKVKVGSVTIPDDPQYQISISYVEDLAAALAAVGGNPNCFGQTYNFAHEKPENIEHLVHLIAEVLEVNCQIDKIPLAVMTERGILPWRDIPLYLADQSLLFDVGKIAALKGISFTDTKTALAKTCEFLAKKVPI